MFKFKVTVKQGKMPYTLTHEYSTDLIFFSITIQYIIHNTYRVSGISKIFALPRIASFNILSISDIHATYSVRVNISNGGLKRLHMLMIY